MTFLQGEIPLRSVSVLTFNSGTLVSLYVILLVTLSCMTSAMADADVDGARLIYPVPRGSMWRHGNATPVNKKDGNLNCGGIKRQWKKNHGMCGLCGDAWDGPRDHEHGGVFWAKVLSQTFKAGSSVKVSSLLSKQQPGTMQFFLCTSEPKTDKPSAECRENVSLEIGEAGGLSYKSDGLQRFVNLTVKIPQSVPCDRCLLRWIFTVDNKACPQCREKETFINCADIRIYDPSVLILRKRLRLRRIKRQIHPGMNHFNSLITNNQNLFLPPGFNRDQSAVNNHQQNQNMPANVHNVVTVHGQQFGRVRQGNSQQILHTNQHREGHGNVNGQFTSQTHVSQSLTPASGDIQNRNQHATGMDSAFPHSSGMTREQSSHNHGTVTSPVHGAVHSKFGSHHHVTGQEAQTAQQSGHEGLTHQDVHILHSQVNRHNSNGEGTAQQSQIFQSQPHASESTRMSQDERPQYQHQAFNRRAQSHQGQEFGHQWPGTSGISQFEEQQHQSSNSPNHHSSDHLSQGQEFAHQRPGTMTISHVETQQNQASNRPDHQTSDHFSQGQEFAHQGPRTMTISHVETQQHQHQASNHLNHNTRDQSRHAQDFGHQQSSLDGSQKSGIDSDHQISEHHSNNKNSNHNRFNEMNMFAHPMFNGRSGPSADLSPHVPDSYREVNGEQNRGQQSETHSQGGSRGGGTTRESSGARTVQNNVHTYTGNNPEPYGTDKAGERNKSESNYYHPNVNTNTTKQEGSDHVQIESTMVNNTIQDNPGYRDSGNDGNNHAPHVSLNVHPQQVHRIGLPNSMHHNMNVQTGGHITHHVGNPMASPIAVQTHVAVGEPIPTVAQLGIDVSQTKPDMGNTAASQAFTTVNINRPNIPSLHPVHTTIVGPDIDTVANAAQNMIKTAHSQFSHTAGVRPDGAPAIITHHASESHTAGVRPNGVPAIITHHSVGSHTAGVRPDGAPAIITHHAVGGHTAGVRPDGAPAIITHHASASQTAGARINGVPAIVTHHAVGGHTAGARPDGVPAIITHHAVGSHMAGVRPDGGPAIITHHARESHTAGVRPNGVPAIITHHAVGRHTAGVRPDGAPAIITHHASASQTAGVRPDGAPTIIAHHASASHTAGVRADGAPAIITHHARASQTAGARPDGAPTIFTHHAIGSHRSDIRPDAPHLHLASSPSLTMNTNPNINAFAPPGMRMDMHPNLQVPVPVTKMENTNTHTHIVSNVHGSSNVGQQMDGTVVQHERSDSPPKIILNQAGSTDITQHKKEVNARVSSDVGNPYGDLTINSPGIININLHGNVHPHIRNIGGRVTEGNENQHTHVVSAGGHSVNSVDIPVINEHVFTDHSVSKGDTSIHDSEIPPEPTKQADLTQLNNFIGPNGLTAGAHPVNVHIPINAPGIINTNPHMNIATGMVNTGLRMLRPVQPTGIVPGSTNGLLNPGAVVAANVHTSNHPASNIPGNTADHINLALGVTGNVHPPGSPVGISTRNAGHINPTVLVTGNVQRPINPNEIVPGTANGPMNPDRLVSGNAPGLVNPTAPVTGIALGPINPKRNNHGPIGPTGIVALNANGPTGNVPRPIMANGFVSGNVHGPIFPTGIVTGNAHGHILPTGHHPSNIHGTVNPTGMSSQTFLSPNVQAEVTEINHHNNNGITVSQQKDGESSNDKQMDGDLVNIQQMHGGMSSSQQNYPGNPLPTGHHLPTEVNGKTSSVQFQNAQRVSTETETHKLGANVNHMDGREGLRQRNSDMSSASGSIETGAQMITKTETDQGYQIPGLSSSNINQPKPPMIQVINPGTPFQHTIITHSDQAPLNTGDIRQGVEGIPNGLPNIHTSENGDIIIHNQQVIMQRPTNAQIQTGSTNEIEGTLQALSNSQPSESPSHGNNLHALPTNPGMSPATGINHLIRNGINNQYTTGESHQSSSSVKVVTAGEEGTQVETYQQNGSGIKEVPNTVNFVPPHQNAGIIPTVFVPTPLVPGPHFPRFVPVGFPNVMVPSSNQVIGSSGQVRSMNAGHVGHVDQSFRQQNENIHTKSSSVHAGNENHMNLNNHMVIPAIEHNHDASNLQHHLLREERINEIENHKASVDINTPLTNQERSTIDASYRPDPHSGNHNKAENTVLTASPSANPGKAGDPVENSGNQDKEIARPRIYINFGDSTTGMPHPQDSTRVEYPGNPVAQHGIHGSHSGTKQTNEAQETIMISSQYHNAITPPPSVNIEESSLSTILPLQVKSYPESTKDGQKLSQELHHGIGTNQEQVMVSNSVHDPQQRSGVRTDKHSADSKFNLNVQGQNQIGISITPQIGSDSQVHYIDPTESNNINLLSKETAEGHISNVQTEISTAANPPYSVDSSGQNNQNIEVIQTTDSAPIQGHTLAMDNGFNVGKSAGSGGNTAVLQKGSTELTDPHLHMNTLSLQGQQELLSSTTKPSTVQSIFVFKEKVMLQNSGKKTNPSHGLETPTVIVNGKNNVHHNNGGVTENQLNGRNVVEGTQAEAVNDGTGTGITPMVPRQKPEIVVKTERFITPDTGLEPERTQKSAKENPTVIVKKERPLILDVGKETAASENIAKEMPKVRANKEENATFEAGKEVINSPNKGPEVSSVDPLLDAVNQNNADLASALLAERLIAFNQGTLQTGNTESSDGAQTVNERGRIDNVASNPEAQHKSESAILAKNKQRSDSMSSINSFTPNAGSFESKPSQLAKDSSTTTRNNGGKERIGGQDLATSNVSAQGLGRFDAGTSSTTEDYYINEADLLSRGVQNIYPDQTVITPSTTEAYYINEAELLSRDLTGRFPRNQQKVTVKPTQNDLREFNAQTQSIDSVRINKDRGGSVKGQSSDVHNTGVSTSTKAYYVNEAELLSNKRLNPSRKQSRTSSHNQHQITSRSIKGSLREFRTSENAGTNVLKEKIDKQLISTLDKTVTPENVQVKPNVYPQDTTVSPIHESKYPKNPDSTSFLKKSSVTLSESNKQISDSRNPQMSSTNEGKQSSSKGESQQPASDILLNRKTSTKTTGTRGKIGAKVKAGGTVSRNTNGKASRDRSGTMRRGRRTVTLSYRRRRPTTPVNRVTSSVYSTTPKYRGGSRHKKGRSFYRTHNGGTRGRTGRRTVTLSYARPKKNPSVTTPYTRPSRGTTTGKENNNLAYKKVDNSKSFLPSDGYAESFTMATSGDTKQTAVTSGSDSTGGRRHVTLSYSNRKSAAGDWSNPSTTTETHFRIESSRSESTIVQTPVTINISSKRNGRENANELETTLQSYSNKASTPDLLRTTTEAYVFTDVKYDSTQNEAYTTETKNIKTTKSKDDTSIGSSNNFIVKVNRKSNLATHNKANSQTSDSKRQMALSKRANNKPISAKYRTGRRTVTLSSKRPGSKRSRNPAETTSNTRSSQKPQYSTTTDGKREVTLSYKNKNVKSLQTSDGDTKSFLESDKSLSTKKQNDQSSDGQRTVTQSYANIEAGARDLQKSGTEMNNLIEKEHSQTQGIVRFPNSVTESFTDNRFDVANETETTLKSYSNRKYKMGLVETTTGSYAIEDLKYDENQNTEQSSYKNNTKEEKRYIETISSGNDENINSSHTPSVKISHLDSQTRNVTDEAYQTSVQGHGSAQKTNRDAQNEDIGERTNIGSEAQVTGRTNNRLTSAKYRAGQRTVTLSYKRPGNRGSRDPAGTTSYTRTSTSPRYSSTTSGKTEVTLDYQNIQNTGVSQTSDSYTESFLDSDKSFSRKNKTGQSSDGKMTVTLPHPGVEAGAGDLQKSGTEMNNPIEKEHSQTQENRQSPTTTTGSFTDNRYRSEVANETETTLKSYSNRESKMGLVETATEKFAIEDLNYGTNQNTEQSSTSTGPPYSSTTSGERGVSIGYQKVKKPSASQTSDSYTESFIDLRSTFTSKADKEQNSDGQTTVTLSYSDREAGEGNLQNGTAINTLVDNENSHNELTGENIPTLDRIILTDKPETARGPETTLESYPTEGSKQGQPETSTESHAFTETRTEENDNLTSSNLQRIGGIINSEFTKSDSKTYNVGNQQVLNKDNDTSTMHSENTQTDGDGPQADSISILNKGFDNRTDSTNDEFMSDRRHDGQTSARRNIERKTVTLSYGRPNNRGSQYSSKTTPYKRRKYSGQPSGKRGVTLAYRQRNRISLNRNPASSRNSRTGFQVKTGQRVVTLPNSRTRVMKDGYKGDSYRGPDTFTESYVDHNITSETIYTSHEYTDYYYYLLGKGKDKSIQNAKQRITDMKNKANGSVEDTSNSASTTANDINQHIRAQKANENLIYTIADKNGGTSRSHGVIGTNEIQRKGYHNSEKENSVLTDKLDDSNRHSSNPNPTLVAEYSNIPDYLMMFNFGRKNQSSELLRRLLRSAVLTTEKNLKLSEISDHFGQNKLLKNELLQMKPSSATNNRADNNRYQANLMTYLTTNEVQEQGLKKEPIVKNVAVDQSYDTSSIAGVNTATPDYSISSASNLPVTSVSAQSHPILAEGATVKSESTSDTVSVASTFITDTSDSKPYQDLSSPSPSNAVKEDKEITTFITHITKGSLSGAGQKDQVNQEGSSFGDLTQNGVTVAMTTSGISPSERKSKKYRTQRSNLSQDIYSTTEAQGKSTDKGQTGVPVMLPDMELSTTKSGKPADFYSLGQSHNDNKQTVIQSQSNGQTVQETIKKQPKDYNVQGSTEQSTYEDHSHLGITVYMYDNGMTTSSTTHTRSGTKPNVYTTGGTTDGRNTRESVKYSVTEGVVGKQTSDVSGTPKYDQPTFQKDLHGDTTHATTNAGAVRLSSNQVKTDESQTSTLSKPTDFSTTTTLRNLQTSTYNSTMPYRQTNAGKTTNVYSNTGTDVSRGTETKENNMYQDSSTSMVSSSAPRQTGAEKQTVHTGIMSTKVGVSTPYNTLVTSDSSTHPDLRNDTTTYGELVTTESQKEMTEKFAINYTTATEPNTRMTPGSVAMTTDMDKSQRGAYLSENSVYTKDNKTSYSPEGSGTIVDVVLQGTRMSHVPNIGTIDNTYEDRGHSLETENKLQSIDESNVRKSDYTVDQDLARRNTEFDHILSDQPISKGVITHQSISQNTENAGDIRRNQFLYTDDIRSAMMKKSAFPTNMPTGSENAYILNGPDFPFIDHSLLLPTSAARVNNLDVKPETFPKEKTDKAPKAHVLSAVQPNARSAQDYVMPTSGLSGLDSFRGVKPADYKTEGKLQSNVIKKQLASKSIELDKHVVTSIPVPHNSMGEGGVKASSISIMSSNVNDQADGENGNKQSSAALNTYTGEVKSNAVENKLSRGVSGIYGNATSQGIKHPDPDTVTLSDQPVIGSSTTSSLGAHTTAETKPATMADNQSTVGINSVRYKHVSSTSHQVADGTVTNTQTAPSDTKTDTVNILVQPYKVPESKTFGDEIASLRADPGSVSRSSTLPILTDYITSGDVTTSGGRVPLLTTIRSAHTPDKIMQDVTTGDQSVFDTSSVSYTQSSSTNQATDHPVSGIQTVSINTQLDSGNILITPYQIINGASFSSQRSSLNTKSDNIRAPSTESSVTDYSRIGDVSKNSGISTNLYQTTVSMSPSDHASSSVHGASYGHSQLLNTTATVDHTSPSQNGRLESEVNVVSGNNGYTTTDSDVKATTSKISDIHYRSSAKTESATVNDKSTHSSMATIESTGYAPSSSHAGTISASTSTSGISTPIVLADGTSTQDRTTAYSDRVTGSGVTSYSGLQNTGTSGGEAASSYNNNKDNTTPQNQEVRYMSETKGDVNNDRIQSKSSTTYRTDGTAVESYHTTQTSTGHEKTVDGLTVKADITSSAQQTTQYSPSTVQVTTNNYNSHTVRHPSTLAQSATSRDPTTTYSGLTGKTGITPSAHQTTQYSPSTVQVTTNIYNSNTGRQSSTLAQSATSRDPTTTYSGLTGKTGITPSAHQTTQYSPSTVHITTNNYNSNTGRQSSTLAQSATSRDPTTTFSGVTGKIEITSSAHQTTQYSPSTVQVTTNNYNSNTGRQSSTLAQSATSRDPTTTFSGVTGKIEITSSAHQTTQYSPSTVGVATNNYNSNTGRQSSTLAQSATSRDPTTTSSGLTGKTDITSSAHQTTQYSPSTVGVATNNYNSNTGRQSSTLAQSATSRDPTTTYSGLTGKTGITPSAHQTTQYSPSTVGVATNNYNSNTVRHPGTMTRSTTSHYPTPTYIRDNPGAGSSSAYRRTERVTVSMATGRQEGTTGVSGMTESSTSGPQLNMETLGPLVTITQELMSRQPGPYVGVTIPSITYSGDKSSTEAVSVSQNEHDMGTTQPIVVSGMQTVGNRREKTTVQGHAGDTSVTGTTMDASGPTTIGSGRLSSHTTTSIVNRDVNHIYAQPYDANVQVLQRLALPAHVSDQYIPGQDVQLTERYTGQGTIQGGTLFHSGNTKGTTTVNTITSTRPPPKSVFTITGNSLGLLNIPLGDWSYIQKLFMNSNQAGSIHISPTMESRARNIRSTNEPLTKANQRDYVGYQKDKLVNVTLRLGNVKTGETSRPGYNKNIAQTGGGDQFGNLATRNSHGGNNLRENLKVKGISSSGQTLCMPEEQFICKDISIHKDTTGSSWWCTINCQYGYCPPKKCKCGCRTIRTGSIRYIDISSYPKNRVGNYGGYFKSPIPRPDFWRYDYHKYKRDMDLHKTKGISSTSSQNVNQSGLSDSKRRRDMLSAIARLLMGSRHRMTAAPTPDNYKLNKVNQTLNASSQGRLRRKYGSLLDLIMSKIQTSGNQTSEPPSSNTSATATYRRQRTTEGVSETKNYITRTNKLVNAPVIRSINSHSQKTSKALSSRRCSPTETFTCVGINEYKHRYHIGWWCTMNCSNGACPLDKCKCECKSNRPKQDQMRHISDTSTQNILYPRVSR